MTATDEPRRINAKTIALIKEFEGLRTHAYRDAVGIWTIGYGHTSVAGLPAVTSGQVVSPDDAEAILARDLRYVASRVAALVVVDLNDNQFGALVSFAFNLGSGALAGSSLLRFVNAGAFDAAANEFRRWVHAGNAVLPGLVRRRAAERALWESAA